MKHIEETVFPKSVKAYNEYGKRVFSYIEAWYVDIPDGNALKEFSQYTESIGERINITKPGKYRWEANDGGFKTYIWRPFDTVLNVYKEIGWI